MDSPQPHQSGGPGFIQIRNVSQGIQILYATVTTRIDGRYDYGITSQILDSMGQVVERRRLNASDVISETRDGGYISVGVLGPDGGSGYESWLSSGPHNNTTFHVLRSTPKGELIWAYPLELRTLRAAKRIIQTSDGGYAVLGISERDLRGYTQYFANFPPYIHSFVCAPGLHRLPVPGPPLVPVAFRAIA